MAQQGQYPINQIHPTLQSYAQQQYPPPPLQPPQPLPYAHQYQQYAYEPLPQLHQPYTLPQYESYDYAYQASQPLYPQGQLYQPHTERATTKRPREALQSDAVGGDAGDFPSPKRKKGQDVLFRIVVPSRHIGKVIGKEGCRIQKIREETKATIKIADAVARYEERVIIISSKENEDGVTDAEKALHQIADLILKDDETLKTSSADVISSVGSVASIATASSVAAVSGTSTAHVAANAIRLLIAGSQAGGLIGVSGQNIEKIRNSSGATITVLAPNQLPYCASAHESDRLVQISGEVPAVLKAVDEIGIQLRENPPKQVISISPAYNFSTTRTAQQYLDPTAAEYVTLDMMISETMVGGLIGRCGSNISRIRNESGAMIKVFGAKGEQKNRQIQLGGTAQQVALAKQRVDEYIYSQLIPQSDPQQVQ